MKTCYKEERKLLVDVRGSKTTVLKLSIIKVNILVSHKGHRQYSSEPIKS